MSAGEAVERGDATVAWERRGTGQSVVLLHGGWLDRQLWSPQVAALADGYDILAIDLRDHGATAFSPPAGGHHHTRGATATGTAKPAYDIDDMAGDVVGVCEQLDIRSPVVCGLSLGGFVAGQLATTHSFDVAGVVLASTPRSLPPIPGHETISSLTPPGGMASVVRWWGPSAAFHALVMAVEFSSGRRWLATSDAARDYAGQTVAKFDADRFLRVWRTLLGVGALGETQLQSLGTPGLVVHGDHEAPAVTGQARGLAADLDGDRVVIDDAGHLCNRDQPAAFTGALREFLSGPVTAA